jgi:hypothetical protein
MKTSQFFLVGLLLFSSAMTYSMALPSDVLLPKDAAEQLNKVTVPMTIACGSTTEVTDCELPRPELNKLISQEIDKAITDAADKVKEEIKEAKIETSEVPQTITDLAIKDGVLLQKVDEIKEEIKQTELVKSSTVEEEEKEEETDRS